MCVCFRLLAYTPLYYHTPVTLGVCVCVCVCVCVSSQVMKGLVEPVGGNKYAWRHMPGITIVPRKTKAGGEGEGDGGEEEAA